MKDVPTFRRSDRVRTMQTDELESVNMANLYCLVYETYEDGNLQVCVKGTQRTMLVHSSEVVKVSNEEWRKH